MSSHFYKMTLTRAALILGFLVMFSLVSGQQKSFEEGVELLDSPSYREHNLNNLPYIDTFPAFAETGDSVIFSCPFNVSDETVVQWSKDGREFYKHDLQENPPGKIYKENTIREFSQSRVTRKTIVLENVTAETNGKYECKVTHYNPNAGNQTSPWTVELFETTLTVVRLPEETPVITVFKNENLTRLECCPPKSDPRPSLTWFRNYETVASSSNHYDSNGCLLLTVSNPPLNTRSHFTCKMDVSVSVTTKLGVESADYVLGVYWSSQTVILPRNSTSNSKGGSRPSNIMLIFSTLLFIHVFRKFVSC